jgi:hypothetical protein
MERPLSSVHKSLQQSTAARLLTHEQSAFQRAALVTYSVRREAVREFVLHGIRYAYPARLGARVRGITTAWSAMPLSGHIISPTDLLVVWQDPEGDARGESIEPLHESALVVAKKNPVIYQALALIDGIRVGQARERKLASELFSALLDEHMR